MNFPLQAVQAVLTTCAICDREDAYQESWVAFLSGGNPLTIAMSYCRQGRRRRQREVLAVDLGLPLDLVVCG